MSTVLIVVLAVLAVLLLMVLAGAVAATRRSRAGAESFSTSLTTVDRELAAATAEDHGWARETLNAAAVEAYAAHRPGIEPTALDLLQIIDERGTDSDLAIYRVIAPDATTRITLGRRDGEWYPQAIEDED